MAKAALTDPIFTDENAAREWLENRLWPDGPICPRCGTIGEATLLKGKSHRPGLYQCNACRKPFTVTVGTLYERSKIPLTKWLAATYLLQSSKKGISALQIGRTLGVSKKTAWFLMHRIRESLRAPGGEAPMGSGGGSVEVDETYYGQNPNARVGKKRNLTNQNRVLTLIDRDTRRARSMLMSEFSIASVTPVLQANIAKEARLLTDEASVYKTPGKSFAAHRAVKHGVGEYVSKKDRTVHTNTVESYFSTFKRGMRGIYQHCSAAHLHRYVAEFDFRYNNREALGVDDQERFARSLPGIVGKRLTYRRTCRAQEVA